MSLWNTEEIINRIKNIVGSDFDYTEIEEPDTESKTPCFTKKVDADFEVSVVPHSVQDENLFLTISIRKTCEDSNYKSWSVIRKTSQESNLMSDIHELITTAKLGKDSSLDENIISLWAVNPDGTICKHPYPMGMYDIDICYDISENCFLIGIETIYMFDDANGPKEYIKHLLHHILEFAKDNEIEIKRPSLFEIADFNLLSGFYSLSDLCSFVVMLFKGYIAD